MKQRSEVRRQRHVFRGLVAMTAFAALAACGKKDAPEAPAATSPVATTAPTAPAPVPGPAKTAVSATRKFNDYIDAYNKLIGTFGLQETYQHYREQHIATAKPQASLLVNEGWVYQARDAFKKARADSADGMQELDQAADALIPPLDRLVGELKEMNLYITSKAYREDDLAKGRQMDPIMLADFETSTARARDFDQVLTRVQHERAVARLAELKQRGDMLAYHSSAAMSEGEALLNMLERPDDVKNPALVQKADATVAELEQTLAAQRSEYDKAKAAAPGPGQGPAYDHEAIARSLTEMIGAYRDFKQSKSGRDHQQMVTAYNNAVSSANNLRR